MQQFAGSLGIEQPRFARAPKLRRRRTSRPSGAMPSEPVPCGERCARHHRQDHSATRADRPGVDAGAQNPQFRMDHSAGMERKTDRDEQIGSVQDQYQRIAPARQLTTSERDGPSGRRCHGNRKAPPWAPRRVRKPDDERQDGHDEESRVEPVRERRKTPGSTLALASCR